MIGAAPVPREHGPDLYPVPNVPSEGRGQHLHYFLVGEIAIDALSASDIL